MDFASAKTYQTPLKARRRQIERGDIDSSVLDQAKSCTGFPCEVLCQDEGSSKKDPRRYCYICQEKTKWQCINCRLYFCMSSKKTSKRDAQCCYIKEKESINSDQVTTRIYGKSCFHNFHENAIRDVINRN